MGTVVKAGPRPENVLGRRKGRPENVSWKKGGGQSEAMRTSEKDHKGIDGDGRNRP